MTDDITDVADAVATDSDTDAAVEVEEVEAPAAPAAAAVNKFPKVVKRDEETGITHYAPKPHVELDPSSRVSD